MLNLWLRFVVCRDFRLSQFLEQVGTTGRSLGRSEGAVQLVGVRTDIDQPTSRKWEEPWRSLGRSGDATRTVGCIHAGRGSGKLVLNAGKRRDVLPKFPDLLQASPEVYDLLADRRLGL